MNRAHIRDLVAEDKRQREKLVLGRTMRRIARQNPPPTESRAKHAALVKRRNDLTDELYRLTNDLDFQLHEKKRRRGGTHVATTAAEGFKFRGQLHARGAIKTVDVAARLMARRRAAAAKAAARSAAIAEKVESMESIFGRGRAQGGRHRERRRSNRRLNKERGVRSRSESPKRAGQAILRGTLAQPPPPPPRSGASGFWEGVGDASEDGVDSLALDDAGESHRMEAVRRAGVDAGERSRRLRFAEAAKAVRKGIREQYHFEHLEALQQRAKRRQGRFYERLEMG
jgi:hypothetical protein